VILESDVAIDGPGSPNCCVSPWATSSWLRREVGVSVHPPTTVLEAVVWWMSLAWTPYDANSSNRDCSFVVYWKVP
jgi:hypothetical protein